MKTKLFTESNTYNKYIAFYVMLIMASFSYAQVGVGNTNPQATLDITASNQAAPSNEDGILIPRIDNFPGTDPTAAQDGILVYLTTTVGLNAKGFYHWDQATTRWIRFSSIEKLNDLSDAKSDVDGSEDGSSIFIGVDAGLNDDSANRKNVGVGYKALEVNTTGNNNAAFGYSTLTNNTANNNSAFGFSAMRVNASGQGNSAFGKRALEKNTSGNHNTAMGADALGENTGAQNTAIGNGAMFTNTLGEENVAIGNLALYDNTTGNGNTAVGTEALTNNTASGTEASSTAVGYHALHQNAGGVRNTAVGYQALLSNTNNNNNSAFGHFALSGNTSGNNTALGSFAGDGSSGNSNVIVGNRAGSELAGNENVLIGQHSGRELVGDSNVFIGKNTGRFTTGDSNVLIGNGAGYHTNLRTLSSTLLIQNNTEATPLIYGDFTNDRVGIAKIATTHALEVEGTTEATQYKLSALNTAPTSATDPGVEGEIRVTNTHIYVCIAPNTWVRTALASW
ncbi:hypothetical protein [Winogradskyella sp. SM1960]|uniref:hypothetical protein n=1 Tax=Winogradskyella sp. SM1960 TaxID=2865955 RepID=UPI001CD45B8A|nr:hypothetical protein [Winogradskyella sp. SM1960]